MKAEQLRKSLSTLKLDEVEDQVGKGSPNADSGFDDANNNNHNNNNNGKDVNDKNEGEGNDLVTTWIGDTAASTSPKIAASGGIGVEAEVDESKGFHYVPAEDKGATKLEKWKS